MNKDGVVSCETRTPLQTRTHMHTRTPTVASTSPTTKYHSNTQPEAATS